ncbi:hypothetical protein [Oceanobacillus profundus]|uniref:Uncharacterized protein n=1 Tax=Oceanobacillus profundus TaxID=372463 RepID=A0A417YGN4_9BACI|nr:hypothetical protein [Oceanobacillus profundus]RHW31977.1 hypothetical protein D1B32_12125 [Oceanobacillus profundus]
MENHQRWYGNKGIDTPYERSLIYYRPNLVFPEKESSHPMTLDVIRQISRSQDFMMTSAILDYRALAERIQELLNMIFGRAESSSFSEYLELLNENKLTEVIEFENSHNGYDGTLDYELYTMLYLMKKSVEEQADFLDENYRTQYTDKTEDEQMIEAEGESINNWIRTEYDLSALYDEVSHGADYDPIIQAEIDALEKKRRDLDQLHTTIADSAYTHRNRYLNLDEIVDKADILINQPQQFIDGNVELLMNQLANANNLPDFRSHLILSFKEYKQKHNLMKNQYMMIDVQKEIYASERSYTYQQIMTKTNDNIKNWLYEQPEDTGKSFDLFANIMVESIKQTKEVYENTLADLMSFYRQEAVFYGRQITLIQKKEEIRHFIRIIEDLEDVVRPSEEWIKEYVQNKGYVTRQT